jgi:hypothetical protein
MLQSSNSCTLTNFGMLEEHLRQFGHKRIFKTNHECNICKKHFETEDYLEFHMKQLHYRGERLQDRYNQRGMVCPADLCDIFECPEFSEKALKAQVYTERSDGNYEGKPDFRDGPRKGGKNKGKAEQTSQIPFRWEMV